MNNNPSHNNGSNRLPWSLVWITGASQGIGRALTLALAQQGVNVAVSARSGDKLAQLISDTEHFSGEVRSFPLDVTDKQAVAKTVEAIESQWSVIDLAVLNAGIFIPMASDQFSSDIVQQQLTLNVMGVCYCIEPLVARFIERKKGHIAINASLAGYRGLPRSGGYGASKAALINLAESMRLELADKGITVQVVNPGFVKTPLTDKNPFPMPCLMEVDKAVEAMIKGLTSKRFEVRFPAGFAAVLGLLKRLPYSVYFYLIKRTVG